MFHLTVQEIQLLLSSKHSGVPRYSQEIIFFKKCPWHDCIMVGMATHQPFPIPLPHTCYQPQLLRAGHLPPNTLLLGDPEAQPQGRGGAGWWGFAGQLLLLYNREEDLSLPRRTCFPPCHVVMWGCDPSV